VDQALFIQFKMRIQVLRHTKRLALLTKYWKDEVEDYRYELFCSKNKDEKALLNSFGTLQHKLVQ